MTVLHHVTVRTLWLVLGALAVAAWVAHGSAESDAESSSGWTATAKKFHWTIRLLSGQVVTYAHHKARLEQDTAQLRRSLHLTQGAVENLVHSIDSLHRAPLTAAVRRFGEACGELAQNCEQRVLSAQDAFAAEHTLRLVEAGRVALADTIIARQHAPCRLLHVGPVKIGCPSRGTSFKVGAAAGVGVLEALRLLIAGHL